MVRNLITVKGLKLTLRALGKTEHLIPEAAGRTNIGVAETLVSFARENVRKRVRFKPNTGRLETGIRIIRRQRKNKTITVGSTMPYSSEVEFGTPPREHESYKRIPLRLRKGWAGNVNPPFIRHPGSRPMYFMTDAIIRLQTVLTIATSHENDMNRVLVDIWKNSWRIGGGLKGTVFFKNIKR